MNILFLTLRVFSATGGVEKVCKVAGRALQLLMEEKAIRKVAIFSMYDDAKDINELYFPATIFRGFGMRKLKFISAAIKEGKDSRVVILSHINLLMVGYLVKLLSPKTKLVLIAHGIEVWQVFPEWKKKMLNKLDLILPVSAFTKTKMMELYGIPENKLTVLNNCLDPFLSLPLKANKNSSLLKKYGIKETDTVLLSLTRLSSSEMYKGYDQVMQAVSDLKPTHPNIKYLIIGKCDTLEFDRINKEIIRLSLENTIILAGFIPDAELAVHFNIADIYIMPSQKEGFGIVFIEALYYGKPVIAGNIDGSVDALKNGLFGLLIDPNDQQQIEASLVKVIANKHHYIPKPQQVMEHFGFETYKQNLQDILIHSCKATVTA